MQSLRNTLAAALIALIPASATAGSFNEISRHLDTDGTFLAFADFEGDGREISQALQDIYAELVVNQPMLALVQMDFNRLFETLGFASIRAIGASSKPLENGIHANRFVISLQEGEPQGLLRMNGDRDSATSTFTAAQLAPADATAAITGIMQLQSLRDMVIALMSQFMGPVGESLAKNQLAATLPKTGITYDELIETLSGKWDVFWHESFDENFNPAYKAWLRVDGAAGLADRLKPLADSMRIHYSETGDGLKADLSSLLPLPGYGLFMETSTKQDSLTLYTHPGWGPNSPGPRLSETGHFRALAKHLPKKALNFSYSDAYDITALIQALTQGSPGVAPYMASIEKTLELLIGDFLKPVISVSYFEKNAFVTDSYATYSVKQATMLLPAALLCGVTAAAAMPVLESMEPSLQEEEEADGACEECEEWQE